MGDGEGDTWVGERRCQFREVALWWEWSQSRGVGRLGLFPGWCPFRCFFLFSCPCIRFSSFVLVADILAPYCHGGFFMGSCLWVGFGCDGEGGRWGWGTSLLGGVLWELEEGLDLQ